MMGVRFGVRFVAPALRRRPTSSTPSNEPSMRIPVMVAAVWTVNPHLRRYSAYTNEGLNTRPDADVILRDLTGSRELSESCHGSRG